MRWQQRKKVEAAPRKYVAELDALIQRAIKEGDDFAIVNARAIVATRNSLRASLVAISSQLNSEIDRLSQEIGQPVPQHQTVNATGPQAPSASEVFRTIQVLSRIWPAKRVQIEVEIRKLLAELGLGTMPTDANPARPT